MTCPIDDRPRARNAAATREIILAAAWRRFLNESYDNVGLRDVAGDAGVDVALVSRYFGGKEGLFRAVLSHGKEGKLDGLADAASLPARLAAMATEQAPDEGCGNMEHLLIILRSASSPAAASIVRSAFSADVLEPLAALIGGERAEQRAAMAMAVMMGTAIIRSVMAVETVCEGACRHDVARRIERLLEVALEEDG
ncbi:TetR/AcrR family transcriptional regulator [Allosphingosinicella flava]|uniref:TetR/AcrR family transcriptional regulator n=1 Tax=Allosphingosinicella flava TaxID=2771430 RepID=A0A7T2GJ73_9SPHN|nr:TetR/AcrR family transcriptional regulator [Sphingosinicella flava]QPQ54845.1 TetR/AcrR family transcriptional regulator [Sphingosinicella flava]